jgi:hypothetical protein
MTKSVTFGNLDKGILLNIDFRNGFKTRILNFLESNHLDIMEEMEFHKGGTINFTGDEIQIKGVNGLLRLDLIDIPSC